jgi:hypothetical protein
LESKQREPLFLIVAGAVTALGLPFALAFPRDLLSKLLAIAALVLAASAIAAAVVAYRRRSQKP